MMIKVLFLICFAKIKYQNVNTFHFLSDFLVWKCEQWEKHLILRRIAEYVLLRHLSLSNENITYIVDQLDFALVHGVGGRYIAISYCLAFLISFLVSSALECYTMLS